MQTHTSTIATTIEHLDFTPSLPCEHSQHARHGDAPATLYVDATCRECGDSARYLLCLPGYARMRTVHCNECGTFATRDEMVTVLEVLA